MNDLMMSDGQCPIGVVYAISFYLFLICNEYRHVLNDTHD